MKLFRSSLATAAVSFSLFTLSFLAFPVSQVSAQDVKIALQRGYRTGYSDGYMSGYRDSIDNTARSYNRHTEYGKADRAYVKDYGTLEDYRDGYQQGFEVGYNTGFDKKSFDAVLPTELKKRGAISPKAAVETAAVTTTQPTMTQKVTTAPDVMTTTTTTTTTADAPDSDAAQATAPTAQIRTQNISYVQTGDQIVIIPADTELTVELLGDISTDSSKAGERFQARVVSPSEIGGAIIEGRIAKVEKPGRIKRRASISLDFDQIRLTDTRWANYNAILTDVLPVKGDNIRRIDTEGTVQGKSSVKNDAIKVGATTGAGLVVGAIVGGPVGAGVGAGVGAAFGVGTIIVEPGKHINIVKGQQLKIRTAYETQIR